MAAPEPVRLERLPRFAWAVIVVVGLSVLSTLIQVVLVRPYLWPAGTGATLAGDPTVHLPIKARPPDVQTAFAGPPEITRVAAGSPAAAKGIARILFIIFLVLFVVSRIMGRGRPPAV